MTTIAYKTDITATISHKKLLDFVKDVMAKDGLQPIEELTIKRKTAKKGEQPEYYITAKCELTSEAPTVCPLCTLPLQRDTIPTSGTPTVDITPDGKARNYPADIPVETVKLDKELGETTVPPEEIQSEMSGRVVEEEDAGTGMGAFVAQSQALIAQKERENRGK